jgi:acetyl/propionyl-CoA carboxylase alpha subunit
VLREVIVKRRTRLAAVFVLFLSLARVTADGETAPFNYEPLLAKRISYSEVVCSATVVSTHKLATTRVIGGSERNEFIAEAIVDKVFKGTLTSSIIAFHYYDFGAREAAH